MNISHAAIEIQVISLTGRIKQSGTVAQTQRGSLPVKFDWRNYDNNKRNYVEGMQMPVFKCYICNKKK